MEVEVEGGQKREEEEGEAGRRKGISRWDVYKSRRLTVSGDQR